MKLDLPDAETLYHHFFTGWIPPEDPRPAHLRSDLEQIELTPGEHIRVLSPLTDEGRQQMDAQIKRTTQAALADIPHLLQREDAPSLEWLDGLENYLTPERIQELLRASNPEKMDNPYFVLCCETGALIGHLLQQQWPRLQWLGDFPYFESSLFDLNAKVRFPVFHWAVKCLSGDERHPLKQKIKASIDYLRGD
ncbi:hypothetical protein P3T73_11570 [Kiritimatiellota bacterium B12222]|nr:hypothetical protein P3T73_11570 [Kiritimatiellota bacterium B12222]